MDDIAVFCENDNNGGTTNRVIKLCQECVETVIKRMYPNTDQNIKIFYEDIDIEQNPEKVVNIYTLAANQGFPNAHRLL